MRAAIRAELFRLLRDRRALLWGFGFVPFLYLLIIAGFDLAPVLSPGFSDVTVDYAQRVAWATSMGGNPFMHLFVAVGAAAIFGGEYRFAAWRLIGPRASRRAILGAKGLSLLLAASASLIVMALGALLIAWISTAANAVKIGHAVSAGGAGIVFLTSLAELLVIGWQAALLVVLTRTLFAGALPPFLFSVGQVMALAYVPPSPSASPLLALPTFAADLLRRWAIGGNGLPVPHGDAVLAAAASLIAWSALLAGATWFVLARQDWSRE